VLKRVLANYEVEFHAHDLALAGRRLHAKALALRTAKGIWLASGSANFSSPAWLQPAARGNTEVVALRFEPDSAYFDPWLEELCENAQPLTLDWEAEPVGAEESAAPTNSLLTLLSASLKGSHLVLRMAESLPHDSMLILRVNTLTPQEFLPNRWTQAQDNTVTLAISQELLALFERPTLVTVEIATPSGSRGSNPMLVHNLRSLSRASQPLRRRDWPRIPEGMAPESYEHCAQILDMLHDLLASNAEQLNRHRGRTVAYTREEQLERQLELEAGYNPDDHFVEERVRTAMATITGGDLYADYDDRLTYEELLRAVLAAIYQPQRPEEPKAGQIADNVTIAEIEPPPPPTSIELRAQMVARIERGFRRLVENFIRGTNDTEYLSSVPPRYLTELFIILLTFLRTSRRHEMLNDAAFADLSLGLLAAFWGRPVQPGAWQTLRQRLSKTDIAQEDTRLGLSVQTWLHAAVVAEVLSHAKQRQIYDLTAWMRQFQVTFREPDVLAEVSDGTYQRLWRTAYPTTAALRPAADIVAQLQQLLQWYDDVSLCAEIATWPGARARSSHGDTAGLKQVPMLDVRMPLVDADLDRCLHAFRLFFQWPQPKEHAWARFTNTNPPTGPEDLESVTIFYRDDEHILSFGARRVSGRWHPVLEKSMTRGALRKVQSIADL
jgi:hypothetical protein